MKLIRSSYHFLGSVYFALILIASVTTFVVVGTFLESATQSHRYAELFTYGSPFFAALLWGFFINILFAATRRWPFRTGHIPFLTTHLGLLMILGGVLVKHYFGVQGTLHVVEGSGSHAVMLPNTYSIAIREKGSAEITRYPLNYVDTYIHENRDNGLVLRQTGFHPHAKERLATWVKGSTVLINGLEPLILTPFTPLSEPQSRVRFYPHEAPVWDLYAFHSSNVAETLEQLYRKNAILVVSERETNKVILQGPLDGELSGEINANLKLFLQFTPETGCEDARCILTIDGLDLIEVPLQGDHALLNTNLLTPYLGDSSLALDIVRPPLVAVIEDNNQSVYLAAFDPHGAVWTCPFHGDRLETLIAYDDGFGGYSIEVELPFDGYKSGRKEKEEAMAFHLMQQLKSEVNTPFQVEALSPPLRLLWRACALTNADFPETLVSFLKEWSKSGCWIYPSAQPLPSSLTKILDAIDWSVEPLMSHSLAGCCWVDKLFTQIDPLLKQGLSPLEILRYLRWPLIEALEKEGFEGEEELLTKVTQQIFSIADALPTAPGVQEDVIPEMQAARLSAYLRSYGIHLNTVMGVPAENEMHEWLHASQGQDVMHSSDISEALAKRIVLETSVSPIHQPLPPGKKLEENLPMVTLFASQGRQGHPLTLAFDRSATGLKWPILGGRYLLGFQPAFQEIPHHIRLRQARQINYPNSTQAYSYEADLIITDRQSGAQLEKTISMNHVHETWDGYRFYLSTIAMPSEGGAKRIQVAVNRDPAKYKLTYPGAIVLSCGIFMFFAAVLRKSR